MSSVDQLLRAPLPSSVRVADPPDGLPHLLVTTRAATAQVFFHGAHVAQWRPANSETPVLWLSAQSYFRGDKAIRGGVPICFPWFGPHSTDRTAPAHGFVRLVDWSLVDVGEAADGTVTLAFALDIHEDTSPLWPHRCRVVYRISIGSTLAVTLDVENPGGEPLTFEAALHSYLSVCDIRQVSITGLEETDYLDKVEGFARRRQGSEPIRFTGETDRVYLDTRAPCWIGDTGWSRAIVVNKSGSRSTVVWNPWAEKAKTFPDFGADEWRRMVCVESANVGAAAVRLEPGASHAMRAEISVDYRAFQTT